MTDTQKEIFTRATEIRQEIEKEFNPMIFTLNKHVLKLKDELYVLQKKCQHEFVNGICKYCGWEEKSK